MRAAVLGAHLLALGCANMQGVAVERWPADFRPPRAEDAEASLPARPMDYYARRWSLTALGPAYGYKLLDPAAAAESPGGKPKSGETTLVQMARSNLALAQSLGLSGAVKVKADEGGLMPLAELRQTPEFQAAPEAYLGWYRMGRHRVGPYVARFAAADAYLKAQDRPDLAFEHGRAGGAVIGASILGVLSLPLLAGAASLTEQASRPQTGPPYRVFPDEEQSRMQRQAGMLLGLGILGLIAPFYIPRELARMDKACADFNAMLDGAAP